MTGGVAATVAIRLNGEPRRVAEGISLLGLLEQLGRDPRTVAVEHNGELVSRRRFGELILQEGDRVEVVQFVQGGSPA